MDEDVRKPHSRRLLYPFERKTPALAGRGEDVNLMSGPLVLLGLGIFLLGRKVIRTRQNRVQGRLAEETTQVPPTQNTTAEEQTVTVKELETISV